MTRQPAPTDSSASLPRSTSASSFQSIALSPPRSAALPSSSFLFSSLSHVWQGLKAAAGSQVAGFTRGLSGGGAPAGGMDEVARTGEKRGRASQLEEERKEREKGRGGKRRRVEFHDEVLFDGGERLANLFVSLC